MALDVYIAPYYTALLMNSVISTPYQLNGTVLIIAFAVSGQPDFSQLSAYPNHLLNS